MFFFIFIIKKKLRISEIFQDFWILNTGTFKNQSILTSLIRVDMIYTTINSRFLFENVKLEMIP